MKKNEQKDTEHYLGGTNWLVKKVTLKFSLVEPGTLYYNIVSMVEHICLFFKRESKCFYIAAFPQCSLSNATTYISNPKY